MPANWISVGFQTDLGDEKETNCGYYWLFRRCGNPVKSSKHAHLLKRKADYL